jgi:ketosteroid isomerase-like protein
MSKEQTSSTDFKNKKIAETMLTALKTQNWELFRSIIATDISWTLPGVSIISGEIKGADAIISRARQIVSHGVSMELKNILYGQYGFALSIHNQATKDNLILDEHLATVCTVRNEKIAKIETFVSDVDGVNAFFSGS